ncbi:hypothetical protein [Flavobacterium sp. SM2513]|uniref:hypothetical protein n=1 Tax=Flavobacterium sp. SM2513 TaxID=3424766 RepID=UPI003D7FD14E
MEFLIEYSKNDSDYVYWAGCHEVWKELLQFSEKDWTDLRIDIAEWDELIVEVFIECILYGDRDFELKATSKLIDERSAILCSIFSIRDSFGIRDNIIESTHIFTLGNKNKLSELLTVRNWAVTIEKESDYKIVPILKDYLNQAIENTINQKNE